MIIWVDKDGNEATPVFEANKSDNMSGDDEVLDSMISENMTLSMPATFLGSDLKLA